MTGGVALVDYGVGNLGSVRNMLRHLDIEHSVVSAPDEVRAAPRLILPGVGAFDRGMAGLRAQRLVGPLTEAARSGTPLLGVCLGFQLLTEGSDEGTVPGLGLLQGRCVRLSPGQGLRVPHMGWNWIEPSIKHPVLADLPADSKFYFAHSYRVSFEDAGLVLATTDYGGIFPAMGVSGNVVGAQFHPEKSHAYGMSLLTAFCRWTP